MANLLSGLKEAIVEVLRPGTSQALGEAQYLKELYDNNSALGPLKPAHIQRRELRRAAKRALAQRIATCLIPTIMKMPQAKSANMAASTSVPTEIVDSTRFATRATA